MTKLVLIAARDRNGVIGYNNGLPWSIPEDLAFFKRVTLGASVIMGRKTHESIGFALPGRENIVLTSKLSTKFKGCITAPALDVALSYCKRHDEEYAFVIGGETLYRQALPQADKLVLTEIDAEFSGDTYFPRVDPEVWVETFRHQLTSVFDPFLPFAFVTYERKSAVNQPKSLYNGISSNHLDAMINEIRNTPAKRVPAPVVFGNTFSVSPSEETIPMTITKEVKHPVHIIALDKDYTDFLPGMGLSHGLSRVLSTNEYQQWLKDAAAETVIRRREELESNPFYRQILPYTVVIFVDSVLDTANLANAEVFTYQRTKQVGESRLAGNYSLGVGGHIDAADVLYSAPSVVNLDATILRNLLREVCLEELEFFNEAGNAIQPNEYANSSDFHVVPYGFIRDDSNNVGKVHLGVVNVIYMRKGCTARCKEAELITGPRMSIDDLKIASDAGTLKFENWSKIIIDDLSGSEMTVKPAVVREVQYDMLSSEYFVLVQKTDKLSELAIEMGTTPRRLMRLNFGIIGDAYFEDGQRVNVPEPTSGTLFTIHTPQALLDSIDNTPHDVAGQHARRLGVVNRATEPADPDASADVIEPHPLKGMLAMPNPTEADLKCLVFEAIWSVIKSWDVNVPEYYSGYCGANGSHVKLILDGMDAAKLQRLQLKLELDPLDPNPQKTVEVTVNLLRHIMENGADCREHGLRYFVTQEMLDRMLAFGLELQPLVDAGVVQVGEAEAVTVSHEEPTL